MFNHRTASWFMMLITLPTLDVSSDACLLDNDRLSGFAEEVRTRSVEG